MRASMSFDLVLATTTVVFAVALMIWIVISR